MKVGLRIDVDTFRGTRLGVTNLCRLLAKHLIKASFFFSVGPDNMGRHLWRLLRPVFLWKMLRTKATTLYGWDIIFKGTIWQGPVIGKKLAHIIRSVSDTGHEVGLHAWDHHYWQANIDKMDSDIIYDSIEKGLEILTSILGHRPSCSAVPGWKCNDKVLIVKDKFDFCYNSDCRGESIFRPIVQGKKLKQLQIPVTLPTYDEVIGRNDISDDNYTQYMLSLLNPDKLNVLTIHAEVEGIAYRDLFDRFLEMAQAKGASFVPLGDLLTDSLKIDTAGMLPKEIPGREGWVACQSTA